ncbi:MAG TPA: type VI secretion system tip protein TssI/VgrG [Thermoanaerobaculia bacterium]|nr:type VI secretion system tip protein TssI/VgrG [Thermoanaerobaculia bacterium]HPA52781.1 type VI secretion system tip protein TssI/VgrG [Thermoanaerobaculia bacterium]HQN09879.1 type VI secretion system tip protein TssI/VgrG [Thermoanaerobaculia bacterium]HQP85978.1 type VI secretion system tip protein TssI/VgrG [Thermoanaerobaculia bacterium]
MGSYVQQNRKIRVTTPIGEDVLLLKSFEGTDELSRPFRYRLEMIAENKAKVPFDGVLGKKVTVHLQLPDESSEHHLNGVCTRFSQAGRDDTFTLYRAELVPEFQLLSRRARSRIFQRMSVPEILKEVMKGVTADWKLQGTYEKRDYCVQYRETDFNFASRLMEEEGIFYFFRQEDGAHTMVVADASSEFPELPGESELIYEELEGGTRDENRIWAWERAQEARSVRCVLWDHCFELPHKHLEAEEPILASVSAGREAHPLAVEGSDEWELYDWPGEYAQRFDGINRSGGEQQDELQKIFHDNARTAGLRMDEEAALAVEIRGSSNVKHLAAGHTLTLKRHFSGDGAYVLASVTHRATFGADYRSGKDEELAYANEFTCFPSALPFRPRRRTPKPVVPGSQTAVVVGPKGEELFTDRYGRVKVQFHWDRDGKHDEDASCWVRVAQLAAGRRWGSSFWPRIGQEVIVDFLEGDPDRPIIVGTVYNADQMPPYLGQGPDGKHRNDNRVSGIKTSTTTGGNGFNELRFDDAKGAEQLFVHAERDLDVRVKNDARESVLNDKHVTVGGKDDGERKGSYLEKVFQDKHVAVLGTLQEKVGDAKLTVGGDEGGGNLDVYVTGSEKRTVGGHAEIRISRCRSTFVGEAEMLEANGDLGILGHQRVAIRGDGAATYSSRERVLIAAPDVAIGEGDNFIRITSSGVTIVGTMVMINSGGCRGEGTAFDPEPVGEADRAEPKVPTAADDAKTGQKSS